MSTEAAGVRPVVALVPAKDTEDSIRATVTALLGLPQVDEVVVVDDGSTDATTERARSAGAWVLRLGANRGKGGAVEAGVNLAGHAGTYLLVDADVGATAAEVAALLGPVLAGEADMAVGVLPSARGRGGFGLVRSAAAAAIRLATGAPTRAPLSGQRAVRGELLRGLDLAPRFGLEVAMTIDARRAGARVVEVPVEMEHRHTGRTVAGFRHRARQGADMVRAAWPRLTSAALRSGLVGLTLLLVVAAVLWSGGRWEAASVPLGERPAKVLIFGMPGLRWDEVGTGRLPNLDALLDRGALAAMTVRTLSRLPSPVEAYATLGAGARVQAGQVAEEATGAGGPVVVPGAAEVREDAGRYVPSKPGALGDALHAAGLRTAVVGTADTPPNLVGLTDIEPIRRTVAVALMDGAGRVDGGSVDPADLLMHDRFAAFQERADPERVALRTEQALQQADVVLVDPGDLDRAADLHGIAPPLFAERYRARAQDLTDDLLGRVVGAAPEGTLVLVVSPVPPEDEWRLTPFVMAGPGVTPGYVHSPSTRRLGLVTLTDVAPTVLAALGLPTPAGMIGHPLRFHPTADVDPGRLGRLDRDIAFRERIYLSVTLAFIAVQAVAYGLIAFALTRPTRPRWASPLRDVALAIAAFPLGTLLFRAVTPFAPGLGDQGAILLPLAILALVAVARRARSSPLAPLGWIFGATVAVLVVDVATGGRLQVGGLLGYSPQSAGRFYGLGNTTFAVLAACTILAAAMHVQRRGRKGLAAVACLFALVVVVDGAPGLGDDVGGILTLVPVLGLTFLALAGRRLTWRLVLAVAALAVAVLVAATAVDLLRPPESRTHLGRLAADTWRDGGEELRTTIARKTAANVRLLRRTPWAWAVPVIAGFLLWVLVVRRRWADLLPPGSPLRIGVVGALAAGLLGFAVNDSGIVVTALVLVEVGPVLAVLALAAPAVPLPAPPAVLLEPTGDAPTRRSLATPQG